MEEEIDEITRRGRHEKGKDNTKDKAEVSSGSKNYIKYRYRRSQKPSNSEEYKLMYVGRSMSLVFIERMKAEELINEAEKGNEERS